jgi:flavodoxin
MSKMIMKYSIRTSFLLIAAMLMVLGCADAQQMKPKNILIVYLSRTKNTKAVAEMIKQNVGGTLVELDLQNPYPQNYKAIVDQVAKENETGFLPPLRTKIDGIEKYDTVFIGFPTWGMQLPPPIKSFLKEYNLKGKTIIPFNTNAGYGIGSSFDQLKELSGGNKVLEGFTIKGGVERDGIMFVMEGGNKVKAENKVKVWLQKIDLSR